MKTRVLAVLFLNALIGGACRTTFTASAEDLGTQLLAQTERRTNLRKMRLYVADFQPCRLGPDGTVTPMDPVMAEQHRASSLRLKHEMMRVLAPHVAVLEGEEYGDAPRTTDDLYKRAAEAGANAILVGNYTHEGYYVIMMLRIVDARERVVLAAAEGHVPHAEAP